MRKLMLVLGFFSVFAVSSVQAQVTLPPTQPLKDAKVIATKFFFEL